jgi:rSAM/selenodomain-associated transferase 1
MKPFRLLDPTHPPLIPVSLCALAVMTKAPRAGQVKTRLVPPLTPDEAAELNKCFLRDTAGGILSATTGNDASAIAVYTPTGTESAYDDILPSDFNLLAQRGVGFGERLYFAAEDLFRCGFDSVCLIDSDSPTVPGKTFLKAIELLKTQGDCMVLGPCDDGGYYLIGLKKPHRELFEQIDWSTKSVFDQTMCRAREIGLEVKLLPPGYDIDDAASLRRLCKELLRDNFRTDIAPNTREFVRELFAQKKLGSVLSAPV